ncbi:MAG TPA: DNA polymerase III subunit alpha [Actinomycetales bacterium]|nr:DNA polymerase III subunit alpha [Actinomycetales bacterium]
MSAATDFAHLHVHTEYSMLDGAAKLEPLFKEAQALGQKALGMTDHGYLFGAYDFYRTAQKYGIKPIIGVEAYLTPGTSRRDRSRVTWGTEAQKNDDVSARGSYTHMTLWAEDNEGLRNLMRMSSLASLDGQWGKWPRMDRELLQNYSKGLIATTGCPSSEVQTRLRLGQFDEAVKAAGEFQEIFGRENFYVELMDHGLEIERRVLKDLLEVAKKIDAPFVATNDSHYVSPTDVNTHAALLCLQSGTTLHDPDRFKFDSDTFYIRPSHEMRAWADEFPGAADNTLLIAERCDVSFTTASQGANYMPHFPVPAGEDEASWFAREVGEGLKNRYPDGVPEEVRARAEYEVGVILQMGFPGYFLVVSDFIRWAKERGIRVGPGRGSGAGSMVAYALDITDLDPIEHGLLFERFLNPERVSMPDFDVDFDDRRRDEVIDYVIEKYGQDHVAQVVTFGTLKPKAALKDAARVLGHPYAVGDALTKAMPPAVMAKDIPLDKLFDPTHERYGEAGQMREMYQDPVNQEVIDLATGLEGIKRQWGVHACAVIMSSAPLTDVIPVMRRPSDGAIITQFEYPLCEDLGLLKMDFLGLRNLTIITDALENIGNNGKEVPDVDHLPLDDRPTYELLSRGDTLGVFQLDGGGLRTLLRQMRPDNFEDISATIALYRPGPMGANSHTNYALRKNGFQKIEPIHRELAEPLAEILDPTYGLIVYQEQVMAIAREVAGFSLGQADLLRRAMGKKKKAELDKQFEAFEAGMLANGYSKDAITTLWNILLPFSDYAFNKSHSAAYGAVSYQTGYLKANYPVEYMAALLTSTGGNKDKMAIYLAECRHMGITVLPPDVNTSAANFTAVGEDIRFGLAGVRNVGAQVVADIVSTREEKGEYTSFLDFMEKVPASVCNKRTIESLIKAGAFDSLGETRRSLVTIHEDAVDEVIQIKRNEAAGQFDLFSAIDDGGASAGGATSLNTEVPQLPEWDKKDKLGFEREMLGLYVSDHPLAGLEHVLSRAADQQIGRLKEDGGAADGQSVVLAGLVTSVQRRITKKGKSWAIVTLEDRTGETEIMFFPPAYQAVSVLLAEDLLVAVKGRVQDRDESITVIAQEMTILDVTAADSRPVTISLPEHRCTVPLVEEIAAVLGRHGGTTQVYIDVDARDGRQRMALSDSFRVDPGPALFGDLKALLGPGCL